MIYKTGARADVAAIAPCRWAIAVLYGDGHVEMDFHSGASVAAAHYDHIVTHEPIAEACLVALRAAVYVTAGHAGAERISGWLPSAAAAAASRYFWPRVAGP